MGHGLPPTRVAHTTPTTTTTSKVVVGLQECSYSVSNAKEVIEEALHDRQLVRTSRPKIQVFFFTQNFRPPSTLPHTTHILDKGRRPP